MTWGNWTPKDRWGVIACCGWCSDYTIRAVGVDIPADTMREAIEALDAHQRACRERARKEST